MDASCSLQSIKECDRVGLISIIKELINNKQLNDKADLAKFKATEIVSNNLPDSIEFWKEGYCLNGSYDGYLIDDCLVGLNGSHNGCENCAMNKVQLVKAYNCKSDSNTTSQLGDEEISIKLSYYSKNENSTDCNYCKVKVTGNKMDQTIESACLESDFKNNDTKIIFDDYNFDGFGDIAFLVEKNNQNLYYAVYLYSNQENRYILNEQARSFSNITVNNDKRQIIVNWMGGGSSWSQDIYKYIDNKFILAE